MDLDATFIMASCTKLMTIIAALQCIEHGQITLDDDVSALLHKLKSPKILTGFKEGTGEPTYQKAKGFITLRSVFLVKERYEDMLRNAGISSLIPQDLDATPWTPGT